MGNDVMSPFLPFLFLLLLNILAEDLPDVQFCEEIESRQGVYFIECQNSVAYLPDPEWCTVFHQCAFGRSFAKCCGTCQHPAGMSLPTCCSKSEAEGGCQNLRLHWDPIAYTCVRPEDVYPKRNCSIPRDDSTTTTTTVTPEISTTTEIYSTTTTTLATTASATSTTATATATATTSTSIPTSTTTKFPICQQQHQQDI